MCNLANYTGLAWAAPAYRLTDVELTARPTEHNPINRLTHLAKTNIPLFAIHGGVDKLVPLEANSGILAERYTALDGVVNLIVPPSQDHSMWKT